MSTIKLNDFIKSVVTIPIQKIAANAKRITPEMIHLPMNAMIHFIADSDRILGIDNSYTLLRNYSGTLNIFHVLDLKLLLGHAVPSKVQIQPIVRAYHKTHLGIKAITNLDRTVAHDPTPLVMNYALLPILNKYTTNTLMLYYEWYNIRATMWDTINQIGSRREHFIRFKMPDTLPSKAEFNKSLNEFKSSGLGSFYSNESFDLLELWNIIHAKSETPVDRVSEDALEHVFLVFSELGISVVIRLIDLIEWAQEDLETASSGLYKFWDSLISLRSHLNTKEVTDVEGSISSSNDNEEIVKQIKERAEAGELSQAEQKGLLKLSQKYKTIEDPKGSGLTLDQLKVTKEDLQLKNEQIAPDLKHITDKSMLYSSINEIDKQYINHVMHKDIVQSTLMLHQAGVIVKDFNVKRKLTAASKLDTYVVNVQPINGPASTIHFTIPVIEEDGTFESGGTRYRLDTQKGETPIVKNKPNSVMLTSYYGKIVVARNDSSASNLSKWLQKTIVSYTNGPTVTNLLYGNCKANGPMVPRAYTAICSEIKSFNINQTDDNDVIDSYQMLFDYENISVNFVEDEIKIATKNELTLCGRANGSNIPLAMDMDGIIYGLWPKNIRSRKAGQIERLGPIPFLLDNDLGIGPIEYTEMAIVNKRIPIILALAYMYGLDRALEELKIPYSLSPINVRVPFNENIYKVKFKDIVYLIDITNIYHRILIGGFAAVKNDVSRYRGSDFNKPNVYNSMLMGLGLTNYHLREIKLIWKMFIEPITKGLLTEMGEPTEFRELLLRASDMLINDHMPDTNSVRYKGYERICGMMYKQLVASVRTHQSQGSMAKIGVSMNPNSVLLDILQDQSIALVEESNPIHNLKEHESFTHVGSGGRSAITMVKNTRGFTEKDVGVVSESSPDSAKVGIRAYLTANPNFTSVRGTVREYDEKTDGSANVISSSSLISPCVTHDDSKRVSFTNIQHSHGVAAVGYEAVPYRTGYEEVIASRVDNLFAISAEENGKVIDVNEKKLSVEYTSGKKQSYELGIYHGTVTGVTIPHTRITDLKKGQAFKKGSILIFNSGFFMRSELNPDTVVYKHGVNARIAFLENSDTIEDGNVITESLAKKLETPVTTLHGVIVDFNTILHNLVKVGDEVTPETILCTLESYISDELEAKDAEVITSLNKIASNNPKAKVYGKVTEVEVMYFGKIEDMHFSLQKIVNKYNGVRAKRVEDFNLDQAKNGKIDETIRVNGRKVVDQQVAIKIYIDGMLSMQSGDKLTVGNQLKSTVSRVDVHGIETENHLPIDCLFGCQSVEARIVGAPYRSGIMNSVIKELSKQMGQRFLNTKSS